MILQFCGLTAFQILASQKRRRTTYPRGPDGWRRKIRDGSHGIWLRHCSPRPAPRPPRLLPVLRQSGGATGRGRAGGSGAVGAAPARPGEGRPERGPALLLSASRADGSGAAGRDGGRAGAVAAGLGLGAGRCEAGTADGEAGTGRGSCCCPAGALRPGARLQCRGAAGSCAWEGEAVWGHGCCGSGRG